MFAAVVRGRHRLADPHPWVLDDSFAMSLVGPAWTEILAGLNGWLREPILREMSAHVVARSRYVEDRLLAGQFSQYVILGAGLDSFAWRRPDVLRWLRIFEVDLPVTQSWKRERAAALSLPINEDHVFAPVDFESEGLRDGLDRAGFDWDQRTLFSWLGVTPYLTAESIKTTLRAVTACAAGSEIVFGYLLTRDFLDDAGREFLDTMVPVATARGELVHTALSPADAESMTERECGLKVSDHPTREDLQARYFADRPDGLTPATYERLITAGVAG